RTGTPGHGPHARHRRWPCPVAEYSRRRPQRQARRRASGAARQAYPAHARGAHLPPAFRWRPSWARQNDKGDKMHQYTLPNLRGRYALATGQAAAYRLNLLHNLYGPGTRRLLPESGLRRGMRVADVGCGVGTVTALLAYLVGPEGHVVGIDASAAQLDQARERVKAGHPNTSFVQASATDTGLT